ncbi:MAG: ACP phosphodiesterase [Bacteroidales bacterium]|jgi:acyl carrier protein phosphodiesterase
MNFLGHLFLSGKNEDIIVGNFIADAVKGNSFNKYPDGIAKGIRLHREIDHFTDHHPVFLSSRSRLYPRYRMYAGVIVDIYYDHYLAKNWQDFSEEKLQYVVSKAYFLLIRRIHLLPPGSKRILPFMITQNWLVNYKDLNSLQRVFNGMDRRTGHRSGMGGAIEDLLIHYQEYESEFKEFFREIINHIQTFRSNLD